MGEGCHGGDGGGGAKASLCERKLRRDKVAAAVKHVNMSNQFRWFPQVIIIIIICLPCSPSSRFWSLCTHDRGELREGAEGQVKEHRSGKRRETQAAAWLIFHLFHFSLFFSWVSLIETSAKTSAACECFPPSLNYQMIVTDAPLLCRYLSARSKLHVY